MTEYSYVLDYAYYNQREKYISLFLNPYYMVEFIKKMETLKQSESLIIEDTFQRRIPYNTNGRIKNDEIYCYKFTGKKIFINFGEKSQVKKFLPSIQHKQCCFSNLIYLCTTEHGDFFILEKTEQKEILYWQDRRVKSLRLILLRKSTSLQCNEIEFQNDLRTPNSEFNLMVDVDEDEKREKEFENINEEVNELEPLFDDYYIRPNHSTLFSIDEWIT